MAMCAPKLGSAEMELFAEKQLAKQLPELIGTYKSSKQEVQLALINEYKTVLQAHNKFKTNKEDCPLAAGELLRVIVALKQNIKKRMDAIANPVDRVQKKQPRLGVCSDDRPDPRGSRGPHPIVALALARKRDLQKNGGVPTKNPAPVGSGKKLPPPFSASSTTPKLNARQPPKAPLPSLIDPWTPPVNPQASPEVLEDGGWSLDSRSEHTHVIPTVTTPKKKEERMFEIENENVPKGSKKPGVIPGVPLKGLQGRFALEDGDKWKTFLQKHGWVVIADIAKHRDVDRMIDGFWEAREGMETGVKRGDTTTWSNDRWSGNYGTGIWNKDGAGQEEWLWQAREKVAPVFESIYRTTKLLTSFEGFCTFRPNTATKSGWWHVDQSLSTVQFQAFQGFLNLIDSNSEDGGLCVVSGSKKIFPKLHTKYGMPLDKKYQPIPAQHLEKLIVNPIKINCKKGDFVMWDARTIHCSQPGSDIKPKNHPHLTRLAAYISMAPLSVATRCNPDPARLTDAQIAVRRKCIEDAKTTTHHAWLCDTALMKTGRHAAAKPVMSLAHYTPPTLTPRMLRLAGLLPHDAAVPSRLPYRSNTVDLRPVSRPVRTVQSKASLLDDVCGDATPSPALRGINPPIDEIVLLSDDKDGEHVSTESMLHTVWEELSAKLSACYIRSYANSSRRTLPGHLELVVSAGIRDTEEELRQASYDTVKEIWNGVQLRLTADKVEQGWGKKSKVQVVPFLKELQAAATRKVVEFCEKIQKNDNIVARIVEGRIKSSPTLSPAHSPAMTLNDVSTFLFSETEDAEWNLPDGLATTHVGSKRPPQDDCIVSAKRVKMVSEEEPAILEDAFDVSEGEEEDDVGFN